MSFGFQVVEFVGERLRQRFARFEQDFQQEFEDEPDRDQRRQRQDPCNQVAPDIESERIALK